MPRSGGSEAPPVESRSRRVELAFWLALALALLPLVVAGVRVLVSPGGDWYPSTDHALIEGQVRAVGHHAVLVGPYSRAGFHFPGPLLFYLLALPYRLLGERSMGLLLGALVSTSARSTVEN